MISDQTRERPLPMTYKEAVYETLLKLVVDLDLPPGTRLVESELSARFGVSKTPVREAIARLESDGFVGIVAHQGATVTSLSWAEYEELATLTDAVEATYLPYVLRTMEAADFARLDDTLTSLAAARLVRDESTYREVVEQMHQDLFGVLGLRNLNRIIESLFRLGNRYSTAFTHAFDDTWDIELELIRSRAECLRTGDAEGAANAARRTHVQLSTLLRQRSTDPRIAKYLTPEITASKQGPRESQQRTPARRRPASDVPPGDPISRPRGGARLLRVPKS